VTSGYSHRPCRDQDEKEDLEQNSSVQLSPLQ